MFFGACVLRSRSYTLTAKQLKVVFIQNICLESRMSGNKTVYVNVESKGEKYTLCALRKRFREEYKCKFIFTVRNEKEKFKFSIDSEDSNAKVYLSGFIKEEIKNIEDDEKGKEIEDKKDNNGYGNGINDVLSDNEEESIEQLLNKKRKERPLHFKPIPLKKMKE